MPRMLPSDVQSLDLLAEAIVKLFLITLETKLHFV